jgi:AbrB family looped-hinge helix DNA binding protein
MIAELREKSQITIPKEIAKSVGLSVGDKLDIYEKDGVIHIMPVAVYPKKYIDELMSEIEETKEKIALGEQPVFDSIESLMANIKASK